MGISFTCFRDILNDEEAYKQFWGITLIKEIKPDELFWYIQEGSKNNISDTFFKSVLPNFLLNKTYEQNEMYFDYWKKMYNKSEENETIYELFTSLLLLCKGNFQVFLDYFKKLVDIFPQKVKIEVDEEEIYKDDEGKDCTRIIRKIVLVNEPTNKQRLNQILHFHFNLLYNEVVPFLREAKIITSCDRSNDEDLYGKEIISKYCEKFLISSEKNLNMEKFFTRNHKILNNVDDIRKGLLESFKKVDEKDLTFSLTNL